MRVRGLLGQLLPLDDHLDVVLVFSSCIVVAPPHGSLVFADETEMLARRAYGGAFVAFLPSQSASVAASKK
ncbi:hypothetical protein FJTKL_05762 [Diaporthe vaccinii]|uniref:Uncharacterized protein n=1 Tax=Diaporthe vaccinii TaxID=105482 RepID=A0ABR4EXS6_9PEZI